MSTERVSIPKLKGLVNYKTWAIRMRGLLVKEGIVQSLTTEIPIGEALQASEKALSLIQLSCEDGPLL